MNNTTYSDGGDDVYTLTRVVTASYIFTGTFSLVGNVIVIAVMLKKYEKASIFKWLLAHLAFCDILFALGLLFDVPNWIEQRWMYNSQLCKVIPSSMFIASIAAEGTVVVIAIERYKGITKPLKVQWNKRDMCLALLVVWLFAAVSVSPYCMVLRTVVEGSHMHCVEYWSENPLKTKNSAFIYSTYMFFGSFVIPMFLLAVLYGRIIFIIRKPIDPIPCFEQIFRKRREKDIRITKLLITVIVAFAICVLPNHFGHFIEAKASLNHTEEEVLRYLMLVPYPFQSMINPIIYSIVDKQFRKDVCVIFCRLRKDKSLNSRDRRTFMTSSKKYSVITYDRSSVASNIALRFDEEQTTSL